MKGRALLVFLVTLISMIQASFAKTPSYIMHEWGTFTSLQGSNGVAMRGLHHEEEKLPSFVATRDIRGELSSARFRPICGKLPCDEHDRLFRSDAGIHVTQKMETPVVYFYAKEPMAVNMSISFPKGIISQYYPAPQSFAPRYPAFALTGGRVDYNLQIVTTPETPPAVSPDSVYAPARETASNFIRVGRDVEKFVFYRGLGNFETQLQITSQGKTPDVIVLKNKGSKIPAAFVVYSTGQKLAMSPVGSIQEMYSHPVGEISTLPSKARPFTEAIGEIKSTIVKSLVETGLYEDEAKAMLNTWERSYFRTPGFRVLYVLSRNETDAILPMTLAPQPSENVRVLIGRVEFLHATEESDLLKKAMAATAENERAFVESLGRRGEAILRRILQIAPVQMIPKIEAQIKIAESLE